MPTEEPQPIKVNGKFYPLWSQFVQDTDYIGGTLEEITDGIPGPTGKITRIYLEPNGTESAVFGVDTDQGWGCACDVHYLGIPAGIKMEPGWLYFYGYSVRWRIRRPTISKR